MSEETPIVVEVSGCGGWCGCLMALIAATLVVKIISTIVAGFVALEKLL